MKENPGEGGDKQDILSLFSQSYPSQPHLGITSAVLDGGRAHYVILIQSSMAAILACQAVLSTK